jgi:uncharacterized repeat protein (TIGR02543 family)
MRLKSFLGFAFKPFLAFSFLLLFDSYAFGAQLKLAWDANTELDLAGYRVYYGTSSGNYGSPVSVGNVTTYTLTGLTQGPTYFVAVTAIDTLLDESGYSNGVSGAATDGTQTFTLASNPTGLQVLVDSVTYTAPQTFSWAAGSSHTLSLSSPQAGSAGTRYAFASWSDGGAQNHTITAPSASTTYTANFTTLYSLSTAVNPSGGGTVSPSGTNWYDNGQSASISAIASSGYAFSGWSGDASGTTNPITMTMNGKKTVTATFLRFIKLA